MPKFPLRLPPFLKHLTSKGTIKRLPYFIYVILYTCVCKYLTEKLSWHTDNIYSSYFIIIPYIFIIANLSSKRLRDMGFNLNPFLCCLILLLPVIPLPIQMLLILYKEIYALLLIALWIVLSIYPPKNDTMPTASSALFSPHGRINRKGFISYLLLYLLGLSLYPAWEIVMFAEGFKPIPSAPEPLLTLAAVFIPCFSVFLLILTIFLCIRRLHDIGKSGSDLAVYLIAITLINHYLPDDIFKYVILPSFLLPFLYLSIAPGTEGPNMYNTPDNKNKHKE